MLIRLTSGADGRIWDPSLITNNRSLITRHEMLIRLTCGTDGRICETLTTTLHVLP